MRIALVGVAAAVALMLPGPSVRAEPASRGGGGIVFGFGESGSDYPAQLALMARDGMNRRLLPLDHVDGLSWSPDGRSVAFENARLVRSADRYEPSIWTMIIDARRGRRRVVRNGVSLWTTSTKSRPPRLIVRNGFSPDWSPNGDAIAFVRERGRLSDCARPCDIWIIDLNEHRQRRVIRDAYSPKWSPDGRTLLFGRGRVRTDLWVFDLATTKARRLVRNGNSPDWSPDGRQIVFSRCGSGLYADCFIYVIRADGTAQRRLFYGSEPIWSPSGREIAFIGRDLRHHRYDAIIRERLDGTGRQVLFAETPYCGCFLLAWGPRDRSR